MSHLLFAFLNCSIILGYVLRAFEISDVHCVTAYLFTTALSQRFQSIGSGRELVSWRGGLYSSWVSPAFRDTNCSCLEANTSFALYLNCFRGACPIGIFQAITLLVARKPTAHRIHPCWAGSRFRVTSVFSSLPLQCMIRRQITSSTYSTCLLS